MRGPVRLRATLDDGCQRFAGTLAARRADLNRFVLATRSECGDEVFDPGAEQCDAGGGCGESEVCIPAACRCAPVDSWTALGQEIARGGDVTPDLALRSFALVFGALPGVQPHPLRLPPVISGTGAVRRALRFLNSFTAEQRAAIDTRIFPISAGAGAPAVSPRTPLPLPPCPVDLAHQARLEAIAADLAGRIGRSLDHPFWIGDSGADVTVTTPAGDVMQVSGYTRPARCIDDPAHPGSKRWVAQEADPLDTCLISLTLFGLTQAGAELDATLAHELYHCFQMELLGVREWLRGPEWLMEGSAEWAGEAHAGGSAGGEGWWTVYLRAPLSLFARSYDALGLFAHLAATAGDAVAWRSIDDMLLLGSLRPGGLAFAAAVSAGGSDFVQTLPMGLARRPELGAAWDATGPGIPGRDVRREFAAGGVARGTAVDGGVPAGAQLLATFALDPSAPRDADPVLDVRIFPPGHGGIAWIGASTPASEQVSGPFTAQYCLQGRCTCPDGSTPPGLQMAPSFQPVLALTGTESPVGFRLEMLSTADICPCPAPDTAVRPLVAGDRCEPPCCGRRCRECAERLPGLTRTCALPPNYPARLPPPPPGAVFCGHDYDPRHRFAGAVGYLLADPADVALRYYEATLAADFHVGRRNVIDSPPLTIVTFEDAEPVAGCLVGGEVAVGRREPTLNLSYVLTPTRGGGCGG